MKFGQIPVGEAEGAILAHSVKHASGVFRKGRVLSPADVEALAASGVESVFAARLAPHDVPEDEAAAAVARVVGGQGTIAQAPFTGRANLHAATRGLAVVDTARVRDLNRLHESLTLATVSPFAVVDQRQMVATVKVIPFAVPRGVLNEALAIIGTAPLVRVEAFRGKRAGLIVTVLPQTKPALVTKSQEAIRERVMGLDGELADSRVTGHDTVEVAAAIRDLHRTGSDPILVFGASAIVDRGDVIPQALADAGGKVVHLGMPVDPGNLMMLGRLHDAAVIGVPSCARSPKLNGFDWVLQRLMAGVAVTAEDVMDMGAGGLLAEIATRPSPREKKPRTQRAPKVVAVVLAAGQSSRMGTNKLLADVGGTELVRRSVAAIAPAVDQVIVVTGRDADHVMAALDGIAASFVHNPDFAHGLSTSLKRGLDAVPPDADAALIALADMPLVDASVAGRLIAAFDPAEHRSICVPVHQGQRGNPVLWAKQHFEALRGLTGDRGARALFDSHTDELVEVVMPDRAVLTDIDTPEALDDFRSGRST
jgi:molybdenum cofactor cytidylyltransferase